MKRLRATHLTMLTPPPSLHTPTLASRTAGVHESSRAEHGTAADMAEANVRILWRLRALEGRTVADNAHDEG